MKHFEILGIGCKKCQDTASLIEKLAKENDIAVKVEKITDPESIMSYKVMATPAIAIDGTVVHSGSLPSSSAVIEWLHQD